MKCLYRKHMDCHGCTSIRADFECQNHCVNDLHKENLKLKRMLKKKTEELELFKASCRSCSAR